MALWGKKDSFAVTGTVSVNVDETTITGANTVFTDELEIGDFVVFENVGDPDDKYQVVGITDDEIIVIKPEYSGANNVADATVTGQNTPKYLNKSDADNTYLISTEESKVTANREKGLQTPGWSKYVTYVDSNGQTRHRAEVLVAMKVAQSDAGDNDEFANS